MSRNSTKARRICFTTHSYVSAVTGKIVMKCSCGCGREFDPVREPWRADHGARWAEGGKDVPENLWPIITSCDTGVDGKAAEDTRQVAKGKRGSDKHFGIKQRTGFRKPPPGMKYDWKRGGYRKDDD